MIELLKLLAEKKCYYFWWSIWLLIVGLSSFGYRKTCNFDELLVFCYTGSWIGNIVILSSLTVLQALEISDHSVYAPSQWEMTLHRDVVSHWLGTCTEWSLKMTNSSEPWRKFRQNDGISISMNRSAWHLRGPVITSLINVFPRWLIWR